MNVELRASNAPLFQFIDAIESISNCTNLIGFLPNYMEFERYHFLIYIVLSWHIKMCVMEEPMRWQSIFYPFILIGQVSAHFCIKCIVVLFHHLDICSLCILIFLFFLRFFTNTLGSINLHHVSFSPITCIRQDLTTPGVRWLKSKKLLGRQISWIENTFTEN